MAVALGVGTTAGDSAEARADLSPQQAVKSAVGTSQYACSKVPITVSVPDPAVVPLEFGCLGGRSYNSDGVLLRASTTSPKVGKTVTLRACSTVGGIPFRNGSFRLLGKSANGKTVKSSLYFDANGCTNWKIGTRYVGTARLYVATVPDDNLASGTSATVTIKSHA